MIDAPGDVDLYRFDVASAGVLEATVGDPGDQSCSVAGAPGGLLRHLPGEPAQQGVVDLVGVALNEFLGLIENAHGVYPPSI